MLVLASILLTGCTTTARTTGAGEPERTVRVSPGEFGSTVTANVGDVLVVTPPARFDEWTLDFSTDILRSLDTAAGRRTPPPRGWTFAVVGAGTTDLACTPYVSGGGAPNAPRFAVTITAQ